MKTILITTLLFCSIAAQSQAVIGFGATTKGLNMNAGYIVNNIVLSGSYDLPLSSAVKPTIASITIGKQFNLSNYDEDNFTTTISAGIAKINYKTFVLDKMVQHKYSTPIFALELAKDWYMGRVYIDVKYANGFYGGVGIKAVLRD